MTPENLSAEGQSLWQLLDALPVYAVRIGYRTDSTAEEREFADALFVVHEAWQLQVRGVTT